MLRNTPTNSHTGKSNQTPYTVAPTKVAAHDIISLKKAFPRWTNTIGNMPGTYKIWTHPVYPWSNIPKGRYQWNIVSRYRRHCRTRSVLESLPLQPDWLNGYHPSLTPETRQHPPYLPWPLRPQQGQHPWALQSPYPQWNFSSHQQGTTFSKLDAKYGFWSVHLDKKSSIMTTFKTYKGKVLVLVHAFQPNNKPRHLPNVHGLDHWPSPRHYSHPWWHLCLWLYSQGAWWAPHPAHAYSSKEQPSIQH